MASAHPDLSPFVIAEISAGGIQLRPSPPVSIAPALSETEQLICLEYPPWDLDVFAPTRQELAAEVAEQISMLWSEYAREDDAVLSEPARKLKVKLLRSFRPGPGYER